VQVTCGLPMPEDATGFTPGFGGIECQVPGTSPLQFHGLYIQPAPAGTQVFFAYNNGGGPVSGGTTFFTDARFMDLMIAHDGSSVTYSARETGEETFTNLGSGPTSPGPFAPGLGVFNFGDGRTVSFFDVFISEDSAPAGATPYAELADRLARDALFPVTNAQSHLNGPDPDPDAAATIVNGLASSIPALLGYASLLPAATPEQQKFVSALNKSIIKLHKEILKAQKAIGKGKSPLKSLEKARLLLESMMGVLRQQ
jgi:hypothetical protein